MRTILCLCAIVLTSCQSTKTAKKIVVSVKDQVVKLVGVNKKYVCSTSKFGEGNKPGSNCTPIGLFKIVEKIGEGMDTNQGFKARQPVKCITGKDGIISRILILDGLEAQNRTTYDRKCYIHGTPYINQLGSKASYGCVRLAPNDIAELCNYVTTETTVEIH